AELKWTSLQQQISDPESAPALPDWWTKELDTKIPEVAKVMPVLLDYHDSLGKSSNTLADEIVTRVREKRDNPRLEATGLLFLGAMDALPQVIDTLERTDVVIRSAAITALRQWMTRGPDNRQELLHALTDSRAGYSKAKAQLILWLLQGISDAEAQRGDTFQLLIDCLNHENLSLRDLAYRQLLVLAPDIA